MSENLKELSAEKQDITIFSLMCHHQRANVILIGQGIRIHDFISKKIIAFSLLSHFRRGVNSFVDFSGS